MAKRHAFTLVELLVVIGIIAVMISILLPSLSKARHQANIVRCAAQMRDIGNAVHMYANASKGALPPFRWDNGAANFSLWGTNGAGVVNLWVYRDTADFNLPTEDGNGLGRLIKTKYLGNNERNIYCPNTKWDNDPAGTWRAVYYFNPHIAVRTVGATQVVQVWWKKMAKYGKYPGGATNSWIQSAPWTGSPNLPVYRKALMTDPMYNINTATHARGDSRVWNLLYADGSVTSYRLDKSVERSGGWNGANAKWQQLLDQSNLIQHLADGGTRMGWNTVYNAIPVDPK